MESADNAEGNQPADDEATQTADESATDSSINEEPAEPELSKEDTGEEPQLEEIDQSLVVVAEELARAGSTGAIEDATKLLPIGEEQLDSNVPVPEPTPAEKSPELVQWEQDHLEWELERFQRWVTLGQWQDVRNLSP